MMSFFEEFGISIDDVVEPQVEEHYTGKARIDHTEITTEEAKSMYNDFANGEVVDTVNYTAIAISDEYKKTVLVMRKADKKFFVVTSEGFLGRHFAIETIVGMRVPMVAVVEEPEVTVETTEEPVAEEVAEVVAEETEEIAVEPVVEIEEPVAEEVEIALANSLVVDSIDTAISTYRQFKGIKPKVFFFTRFRRYLDITLIPVFNKVECMDKELLRELGYLQNNVDNLMRTIKTISMGNDKKVEVTV